MEQLTFPETKICGTCRFMLHRSGRYPCSDLYCIMKRKKVSKHTLACEHYVEARIQPWPREK